MRFPIPVRTDCIILFLLSGGGGDDDGLDVVDGDEMEDEDVDTVSIVVLLRSAVSASFLFKFLCFLVGVFFFFVSVSS